MPTRAAGAGDLADSASALSVFRQKLRCLRGIRAFTFLTKRCEDFTATAAVVAEGLEAITGYLGFEGNPDTRVALDRFK